MYKWCDKFNLKGFLDSNWDGTLYSRKSKSGYCVKLHKSTGKIRCTSMLQNCVSTCTAELNALVEAGKEAVHLPNNLKETNIDVERTLQVSVDKQASTALGKNCRNHSKQSTLR